MSSDQPQSASIGMSAGGNVRSGGGAASAVTGAFRNPSFTICLVLLVALTAGFQLLLKSSGATLVKAAAPLKAPLRLLEASKLGSYELVQAHDIKPEILDALGTRDYIQWTFRDKLADPGSPESILHLFVTYYTDTPGLVPHVPEECYLGGGFQQSGEEIVSLAIPTLSQTVKAKLLSFSKPGMMGRDTQLVMYTFNTNGRFEPDRHLVRMVLNDPRSRHAYFSKVEVSFGGAGVVVPRDKAIAAGQRFFERVLPVLVHDHWPDWDALERAGDAKEAAKASM